VGVEELKKRIEKKFEEVLPEAKKFKSKALKIKEEKGNVWDALTNIGYAEDGIAGRYRTILHFLPDWAEEEGVEFGKALDIAGDIFEKYYHEFAETFRKITDQLTWKSKEKLKEVV